MEIHSKPLGAKVVTHCMKMFSLKKLLNIIKHMFLHVPCNNNLLEPFQTKSIIFNFEGTFPIFYLQNLTNLSAAGGSILSVDIF